MKPTNRDGILRGGTAVLIRLLILAAAGVSAYLLSVSLSGGIAVGCGPGSACDEVLHSRWAYAAGIPVSALALVVDLTLLLSTLACGSKSSPKQRRGAWEIIVPCSILIVGAALWFVALQALVLHRFCPWCMTAHICGALAGIILLTRVPIHATRPESGKRKGDHERSVSLASSTVLKLGLGAIVAIALLGVAQTLIAPKTYSIASVAAAPTNVLAQAAPSVVLPKTNTTAAVPTNPPAPIVNSHPTDLPTNDAPAALVASAKALDVLGGRFHLDLAQVPVWGSPDAPFKLLSLFDYTCHHCREMHPVVQEVQRSFGGKLAVVSLPMPLDSQCNYTMRVTPRPHTNSCIYAKLGLIVWRARPTAIQSFDDWFFSFKTPPPLDAVTNKIIELVGLLPFEAASRDSWAERQLRADIDIYATSFRQFNQGSMPQFLIGTNIVAGTLTAEQLHAVVARSIQSSGVP